MLLKPEECMLVIRSSSTVIKLKSVEGCLKCVISGR